jgi:hypothetical protein
MKQSRFFYVTLAFCLSCWVSIVAQERGNWRAASSTARSITGDIALSAEKILIGFTTFPIAQIRPLQPGELKAAFDLDTDPAGTGSLYKLNIPASQKFLKKNSLCGGEDTQWMVTHVVGHDMQVAFFSGAQVPLFTPEAIATTTNLCGIYAYVK